MRRRYVFRDGAFRDPATGEPMPIPERDGVCVPMVIPDIEPYQSPIDGRVITGRAAKRDDLRRHDCVDARDLPSATGGKLKNRRFAERRGLTHRLSEDA